MIKYTSNKPATQAQFISALHKIEAALQRGDELVNVFDNNLSIPLAKLIGATARMTKPNPGQVQVLFLEHKKHWVLVAWFEGMPETIKTEENGIAIQFWPKKHISYDDLVELQKKSLFKEDGIKMQSLSV